jgi:hypothetical protein
LITFTVKGREGKYKFVKTERGFTFGSKLNTDGKTGKGRPSKFSNDLVTTSEPLPVLVQDELELQSGPVVVLDPTVEPDGNDNHKVPDSEVERLKSDTFLPLE